MTSRKDYRKAMKVAGTAGRDRDKAVGAIRMALDKLYYWQKQQSNNNWIVLINDLEQGLGERDRLSYWPKRAD
jgi:hypothetical protein